MKKLSNKDDWCKLYNPSGFNKRSRLKNFFSYSLQNYEYFSIIKKFLKPEYKTIFEIGCAPGGYLIKANKKLNLIPFGVDYTKNGVKLSKTNLRSAGISNFKIIEADVFNHTFQKQYENKFDVVFSNGFAEHFDDFYKTIDAHTKLCRKGGLVIVSMPNLHYLNKLLSTKDMLKITNLEIIDDNFLKTHTPRGLKILFCKYYGGLFNTGLFSFNNKILETLRLTAFTIQRIIFDPLFILLYKIGIRFNCKYSSPCIVVIYEKK